MSLFRRDTARGISFPPPQDYIARSGSLASQGIDDNTALKNSAVWAALRLRADIVSMCPVDVYRKIGTINVNVPTPPVLESPNGKIDMGEFMYSSQFDLDRIGNTFGVIESKDNQGVPRVVEPVQAKKVVVQVRSGLVTYRIDNTVYQPDQVWHERQYTMSGLPVGLSPVMYAAMVLGEYRTIEQFAVDWFANGTMPSAVLKNTARQFDNKTADAMKARFKASTATGDPLIVGSDWDFSMMTADTAASTWIDAKRYDDVAAARFFNVPADAIDASVNSKGGDIVYANITQKSLALLITSLQGSITRRERRLKEWTSAPRLVKLNTDVMLRMDPAGRAGMLAAQVAARLRTNSEARGYDDLPPLTTADIDEFDAIYGPPASSALVAESNNGDTGRALHGPINIRVDAPITLPETRVTPEFRIINDVAVPAQLEQAPPVVNVTVEAPETTIRLVDADGD